MGLLTRAGNIIGDIDRNVPAGSKRDRMVGALAGGIEATQNLLAGKYAQAIQQSLSPANTAQYAPLAYGLIGAGGSALGNVMSGEEKDPGRILAEAAGAGALGALAGRAIGGAGAGLQKARAAYTPKMERLNKEAIAYANREAAARAAGATSTSAAARSRLLGKVNQLAENEKIMNQLIRDSRMLQGLNLATVPALAGLGGMAGGGVSNVVQYMGVPGFEQNTISDPELATSSNTPMARSYTPTLRYLG